MRAAVSATAAVSAPASMSQYAVCSAVRAVTVPTTSASPASAHTIVRAKATASTAPRPGTRSPIAATATIAAGGSSLGPSRNAAFLPCAWAATKGSMVSGPP